MTNTPPPAESAVPNTPAADDVPFLSLASLRVAHRELLQLRRGSPADAELTAAVTTFLQRGRLAGQYLDADEDRWEAQNLLDYWENELFHAGHEVADALLLPFDPALQPTIPDHLCPYVGLDAFQPQQRELFFGRSQLIAELVAQVNGSRLVGVLGPSGSGKSSAVLAGLLPQLQAGHALPGSDQWHYLPPIVPGSAPLTTLARLLAPPDAAPHDRPDAVDAFRQNATHLAD
ncbi:MAG: hypothetical protein KC425_08600, partial [Anaerolineales bacterium]|nr:hypothetical protein [Anaerolineales bacterium]